MIAAIDPPSVAPGDTIVRGGNVATAGDRGVSLHIGDLAETGSTVDGDELAATITAVVPTGLTARSVAVRVVNYRGVTSDPYPYTIKATSPAGD